jgi:hypothetical protein
VNLIRHAVGLLALSAVLAQLPASAQSSASLTTADLAGVWTVIQNSKATDTLREISLQPNGDAVLKHTTMSFQRQWKFGAGVLTILPGKKEFAPGPPDNYRVLAFDATRKQLDIRNDLLNREIRLAKAQ